MRHDRRIAAIDLSRDRHRVCKLRQGDGGRSGHVVVSTLLVFLDEEGNQWFDTAAQVHSKISKIPKF